MSSRRRLWDRGHRWPRVPPDFREHALDTIQARGEIDALEVQNLREDLIRPADDLALLARSHRPRRPRADASSDGGRRKASAPRGPCIRRLPTRALAMSTRGAMRYSARAAVSTSSLALSDPAALAEYRSEEHTSELQSLRHLVCRLLL